MSQQDHDQYKELIVYEPFFKEQISITTTKARKVKRKRNNKFADNEKQQIVRKAEQHIRDCRIVISRIHRMVHQEGKLEYNTLESDRKRVFILYGMSEIMQDELDEAIAR